jgi:hypothetical protein
MVIVESKQISGGTRHLSPKLKGMRGKIPKKIKNQKFYKSRT